jgi:uncharacterized membrane protein YvbJ
MVVNMFCPNCGHKSFNVNFCPYCGSNLQSTKYVYTPQKMPVYQTPTVVAQSANNKIHKQFVLIDHLPLLVVVCLIAVVIFGMLVYVLI